MSVDDNTVVVSSLAITEKRPSQSQRPGGCVGIFFQLFDWHRRFAKKKLFSRKLLPPARPRRFKGDEKMPAAKLHLIAGENKGGFPNLKKNGVKNMDLEPRHGMRAPGLVARLMGLESMPTMHREKVKKTEKENPPCEGDRLTTSNGSSEPVGEDLYKEKGQIKHELRPQKLQKTGLSEGGAVTRFGAEALQIKGVLSRSRKHHHPKLLSPVKSPRIPCVKNASRSSRLIDAATKILEPGLQNKSRTKYAALTYSAPSYNPPGNEVIRERLQFIPPDTLKQSSCEVAANSPVGQTSCKNCGNLVDFADTSSDVEGMASGNTSGGPSIRYTYCRGSALKNPRPTVHEVEDEEQVLYKRRQEECTSPESGMTYKFLANSYDVKDVKSCSVEYLEQQHLSSEKLNLQKNGSTCMATKNHSQANQMSVGSSVRAGAKSNDLKSRRVSSAQNAALGRKDFIALNRSLSGQARPRVPAKADKSSINTSKRYSAKGNDTSSSLRSPVQKIRTMDVTEPTQNANFVCSNVRRQRDARRNIVQGRGMGHSTHSNSEACFKRRSMMEGKGISSSSCKSNGVVSFTFNSPLRQKNAFSTESESTVLEQNNSFSERTPKKGVALEFSNDKAAKCKQLPLSGDALGALLEQKLRELLSQEDEMASAGCTPKQSTAAILQELIAALTAEPSLSQYCEISNSVQAKKENREVGSWHGVNHFSPGTVLDASFSSDSCISSSMDDTPGRVTQPDITDYSHEHQQMSSKEDLLDSAASFNQGMTHHSMLTNFMESITRVISSVNPSMIRDAGIKFSHAKGVILHTELLFANLKWAKLDGLEQSVISTYLIDKLEDSAATSWRDFNRFSCTKVGYQLREFVFDCLVEYLDSKHHPCCYYGYKGWTKQALYLNADVLIQAVEEEVRKWIALSYMTPEEIIELEMSHSLGKWTDFDIEAFECGVDIDGDVLENLIEEIIIDLWQCRTTS